MADLEAAMISIDEELCVDFISNGCPIVAEPCNGLDIACIDGMCVESE